MKKYLHIGYPKNLSTTLQSNFFSQHSKLLHVGIGYDGKNLEYINDKLSIFMEGLLRARDIEFKKINDKLSEHIKHSIAEAVSDENEYYGISHENLSFHFSNDEVDITQKIARLYDFLGNGTKIIVIIRNQFDLIKSLYKESLKAGLSIDFFDYVKNLYMGKIHSYLSELEYSSVIDLYSKTFGKDNILILPVENFKFNGVLIKNGNKISLIDEICNFLGIDYSLKDFHHNNKSMNDKEAFQLLKINRQKRFGLSNGNYFPIDIHKYRDIFNYSEYQHPDLYNEVKIKRANLEKSKIMVKFDNRKLDYCTNVSVTNKIKEMFIASNKKLVEFYDVNLPKSYFELNI